MSARPRPDVERGDGRSPTALIQRLAAGDQAVQDVVCRRYGPRVERMVRRRLGRALRARVETADLSQDVLGDILAAAGGMWFESELAFLRWLRCMVERRILRTARHWRARKRRAARELRLGSRVEIADSGLATPSELLDRRERFEALGAAIACLPPEDRDVIILRHFLELPWRPTAASLGVTEEAAQMRLHRARARLKKLLGELSAATR
jgi:RNA polymerase sigma-70 factor (ECF subfamily)